MKISSWQLDVALDPARIASLKSFHDGPRWDGIGNHGGMGTGLRLVLAGCTFHGDPGRDDEAAEAWANELKYYFKRGVGEQPVVTYDSSIGVYTVIGLMQTTHPGDYPDKDGIVWFT